MCDGLNNLRKKMQGIPAQVHAAFWYLICSFLQKGISVITTPIFTRIMTTEEYGRYSVFNSWMEIVATFVTLNIASGVYMRDLVKFENRRREYTSSMQGLMALMVAGWSLLYLLTHDFWNRLFSLTTVQMLAMLLMIWMTEAFKLWSASQRVNFRYRNLVILTVLVSIAKPMVGIFLVIHARDKVTARILGLTLVEVVSYSGLMFAQVMQGKKLYIPEFWKHALLFSIPLIPHCLSQTVLNSADRIMIGNMVSDSAAGIYSLACSVSNLMMLFTVSLQQTLEPWRYSKQKAGRQQDIARIMYPTLIMIAGLILALIACAPEIVRIFAPAEYYDAIWVIPPVAMSVYFTFAFGFFANFEFYFEKTGYISAATVVGAVLNIVLNYIFIGIFGYYAAGYTTLFCYIVYTACHYCVMRKICKDELGGMTVYSLKKLLAITAAFMALGFALLLTYGAAPLRYALLVAFALVIFLKRRWLIDMVKQLLSMPKNGKDT